VQVLLIIPGALQANA